MIFQKHFVLLAASLAVAPIYSVAVRATAPLDAAVAFGTREYLHDVSISPDGKRIAFVRSDGSRARVVEVVETGTAKIVPVLRSSGDLDQVRYCKWAAPTRLTCMVVLRSDGTSSALGYSRMVALDADGGNLQMLSARTSSNALGFTQSGGNLIDLLADETGTNATGLVLMTRIVLQEYSTGTHLAESRSGLSVERVDTATLKRSMVEQPRPNAQAYITDGHGNVRILGIGSTTSSGYEGNRISYSYRTAGSREWKALSSLTIVGDRALGFKPLAVDRDLNVVYGFDDADGRQALYRIALDGTLKRELVASDPHVDIDGLIQIGRQQRVVGASYVTDRRHTVFFDPALKKLGEALGKAIPGLPLISFVDASADETRLILFAGSDVEPGKYFLYDKTKRTLEELLPQRPRLASVTLATVKAVSYPAADGTMIPGYLTLPPGSNGKDLPAIVMPHGGPAARDEWGFDWLSQFYANRGFAVLQPNYRGSTGYGDGWFEKNGFQSWRTAIGDVNDGGRWLQAQGIAAPGKLAIVGWSYGGYAALQSPALDPALFKAIVAIAPVTDLEMVRNEARDFMNFPQVDAQIGHGPHVREGSPLQNIASITAPVLMFHGDRDWNVGVSESRAMASKLRSAGKSVEYVEYPKLDHQLPDDKVRAEMLAKSDAFLRKALALQP